MAFPNIQTNVPVGTQMVSTIDDFERETRAWLKQCMQQISGYPDVTTVRVLGWNNSTRPTSSPNGNYLLGYNTQLQSLELIGTNGASTPVLSDAIKKQIALLAHPVGEYYWTSNTSFNPATAWGGTWERIQDGRVLISNNGSHTVGSTGGSETVTLTINQMPSHSHPHTHRHKHTRGTMNITGKTGSTGYSSTSPTADGAFYSYATGTGIDDWDNDNQLIAFDASRNWTGSTSEDATAASAHAQGGGQAHSNMQPFRTAILWHRTA